MAFPSWVGKPVAWIARSAIEIYLLVDSGTRLYLKGLLPVTVTNILPRHWEMVENEKSRVFWFTEYRMYAYWFLFSSKKMSLWYIVAAKLELCSLFCFVLVCIDLIDFPKGELIYGFHWGRIVVMSSVTRLWVIWALRQLASLTHKWCTHPIKDWLFSSPQVSEG